MKIDNSIFEDVKKELLDKLSTQQKIEQANSHDKSVKYVLFLIDTQMKHEIDTAKKRLSLEYGDNEVFAKLFSIEKIVKFISPDEPINAFSLYEKTFHRHISKPESVQEQLKNEFKPWAARHRKKILTALRKKKISKKLLQEKEQELENEIKAARVEHDFIVDNFDNLEVKISSLLKRPSYGIVLRYRQSSQEDYKTQRLKKSTANAIWYKEGSAITPKHNKIESFLKKAKNAYGDVYYVFKNEDA